MRARLSCGLLQEPPLITAWLMAQSLENSLLPSASIAVEPPASMAFAAAIRDTTKKAPAEVLKRVRRSTSPEQPLDAKDRLESVVILGIMPGVRPTAIVPGTRPYVRFEVLPLDCYC